MGYVNIITLTLWNVRNVIRQQNKQAGVRETCTSLDGIYRLSQTPFYHVDQLKEILLYCAKMA